MWLNNHFCCLLALLTSLQKVKKQASDLQHVLADQRRDVDHDTSSELLVVIIDTKFTNIFYYYYFFGLDDLFQTISTVRTFRFVLLWLRCGAAFQEYINININI